MLRPVDTDLWVAEHPLRLLGCNFGTRATVVRLRQDPAATGSEGVLWIHSPVPLEDGLAAELQALGPVRYLVAPNKVHHFWVAENAAAFPDAQLFLAPGLADKVPKLPPGETLGSRSPWSAELDELYCGEGWSFLNETVFLHKATQTLILTDLAFNLREPRGALERLVLKGLGAYDRLGPSRLAKVTLRERDKVRTAIDRMLAWDFERVILAHGEICEKGGRDQLREAYAFL